MRPLALAAAVVVAVMLAGCGNTLQSKPVANIELERLVEVQEYPVYWLGGRFEGLALASASEDPSGAYTLQYGTCFVGGQEACLTPLEVITTPETSHLPGEDMLGAQKTTIRGARTLIVQRGQVLALATGPVVVEVRSRRRKLALAAAATMTPINEVGEPGTTLPAVVRIPASQRKALPGQGPHPLMLLPSAPRKS
ncbi:MAG: hypothetical protein ACYCU0_13905 [Solirubrobacteraceae bacterium]